MTVLLDSSVLVAALVEDEPNHRVCLPLLAGKGAAAWSHALSETYSTLTGGRLGLRVSPAVATQLIEQSLVPRLRMVELAAAEILKAMRRTDAAGVRGGAFYDFLHLAAARTAGADTLYSLNARHFIAVANSPGDPEIRHPGRAGG
jgi:predicted nucleic acid-binding protein